VRSCGHVTKCEDKYSDCALIHAVWSNFYAILFPFNQITFTENQQVGFDSVWIYCDHFICAVDGHWGENSKNITLHTPRLSVSCRTVLAYFSFDLTQPKYNIVMLVIGNSDYCTMHAACVCAHARVCMYSMVGSSIETRLTWRHVDFRW